MNKKFISGITVAMATMMLAACGGGTTGGNGSSTPAGNTGRGHNTAATLLDYDAKENDVSMDIFAYYPDNTENGMKLAKEAGITDFLLTRNGEYITTAPDKVQATIEMAAKYGIKSFPFTGHIIDSDAGLMRENAPWLYDNDNISGIYYYDEPLMDQIPKLKERIEFFEENFPGKTYLVALHPSTVVDNIVWNSDANYEEYVYTVCTELLDNLSEDSRKILMADCYPLIYERGEYSIKPSHLYNLMELAVQAKDHGAEANLAIQTLWHTVGNGSMEYPQPTVNSIRMQAYSLLSFGYKNYTLYCYDTRPDVPNMEENIMGMVENGEKTPVYDAVKQVNQEILSYDHVYLSFDWDGIIPVVPTNDERANYGQLKSFGKYVLSAEDTKVLTSIDSDNNIICGVMSDEAGNEGYALTNYTNPWNGKTALVDMTFDDCNKAIVYINGEKSVVDLTNGVLELELAPCDGAFVIPYKA